VRDASEADALAIGAIYGHEVLHGLGTFEEVPPTWNDTVGRIAAVRAHRLPYLVAEEDGQVIGFAYAAPFRPRAAYRYTAEDSVYVHPAFVGRGVGKALVSEVITACEVLGLRQLLAVIGDSANAASIGLHRSLGFVDAGIGRAVGFKHGRWVDTVWMQRALNAGDTDLPTAPGLTLTGH
jgi:phosphinothricin acetyltransferase